MPSFIERRQARFLNQTSFAGKGRFRKAIYVRPGDFAVPVGFSAPGGSPGTQVACGTGSLFSGCVLLADISTSAFGACRATAIQLPALMFGAGASPASRVYAVAVIPKPPDADTTGSIIAYVDWTYGDAALQSGCKKSFELAAAYLDGLAATPTTARTAASTGGASIASYVGTACGIMQSTCLGKLPSWGASDNAAVLVFCIGASNANVDGTLITACTFVLGLRLEYMAKQLGRFTDE